MKNILRFILVYLIIVIALVAFNYNLISNTQDKLSVIQAQLQGVEFLQNLHNLSILVAKNMDKSPGYIVQKKDDLHKEIVQSVDKIIKLQKENPELKNDEFQAKLEKIKTQSMSEGECYEFLNSINHENYAIGDKSKLFFQRDRELYFLGTLVTHYVPEFLISTLIGHNLVETLWQEKTLSDKEKLMFTQQNKLIYLSVEEIEGIINLLDKYENAKKLKSYVINIRREMSTVLAPSLNDWAYDEKNVQECIERSHNILDISYELSNEIFERIEESLNSRAAEQKSKISEYTLIVLFGFLGFTFLTLLYYRKDRENLKKDIEIKNMNRVLDKFVIFYKTDKNGLITYASSALEDLSGFSEEEYLGKTPRIFKHEDTEPSVYKKMWKTILAKRTYKGTLLNKTKLGASYWAEITIVPELDVSKKVVAYSAYIVDVSNQKNLQAKTHELTLANAQLEKLSQLDALTQIYNRLKLDSVMQNLYDSYKRYDKLFSIMIIDVDYFKSVNDSYGHLVGDGVLVGMVNIIRKNIRNTDVLGRFGGEEFMIISQETDCEGAYRLAQKIREEVEKHEFKEVGKKTVSIGVAQIEPHISINNLIKSADDALYEAKANGRNQVKKHINL